MKTTFLSLIILFTLILTNVSAQNQQDTKKVTIETKSSGTHTGEIVFESMDSIRIKTENFGVLSIAKSDIIYQDLVHIILKGGNEYTGTIIKQDSETLVFKSIQLGEITLRSSDVISIKEVSAENVKDGMLWPENTQETRYFWAPNGFGLQKGEGYYHNIWVLWNQVAYGVSDNFSIGGGIIPLFLFAGAPTPAFVTAKLSVPIENANINLAAGAIVGAVLGESEAGFGILYGQSTFGTRDKNFSAGLGFAFAGGEFASSPLINFNGMIRTGRRGYFITENYVLIVDGEVGVVISGGGRTIFKRAALDYGLFIPIVPDMGTFIAFPWLGFSIPFGKFE